MALRRRRSARSIMSSNPRITVPAPRSSTSSSQAPRAEAAGRDLRVVVAAALVGDPRVQEQEVEEVLLQFAPPEQAHDRDAEPLLEDLGHPARHAPRGHAADVRVMGDVADEPDEGSVAEDGEGEVHIREMGAPRHVGVVGDEEVAVMEVVSELLEHALHESAHRRDVNRQGLLGLGDEPAVDVHDGRRVVAPLLDVRRVGALHEGEEALVGESSGGRSTGSRGRPRRARSSPTRCRSKKSGSTSRLRSRSSWISSVEGDREVRMGVHPGAIARVHHGGRVELLHDGRARDLGPGSEPVPIEYGGVHGGVRVEPDRPDFVRHGRGDGSGRATHRRIAAGASERGETDVHHLHRVVGVVVAVGDVVDLEEAGRDPRD